MKKIFVDSSFFIAILHRGDQHHKESTSIASKLSGVQFVTSEMVLVEVLNSLASKGKYVRNVAVNYIEEMFKNKATLIVTQNRMQFTTALDLYKKLDDKTCGLTDCMSCNIMQEEEIVDVLTFDKKDFSRYRVNLSS